ncbi:MAG TPA: hypothetical protein VES68_01830 [Candidatus Sulfotelmatobacter sp.]|nr:hypothetical protein [Candidatus Sulfotelmatobacter sp.]
MKILPHLKFSELPKELQEKKIDEYIKYFYKGEKSLKDALADKKERAKAKKSIQTNFPLYFDEL